MGQQIIKQPDGRYAVFSSAVDGFVLVNASPDEIIEDFVQSERERITESVHKKIDLLDRGENPYFQFTLTWEQALAIHQAKFGNIEGGSHLAKEMK